MPISCNRWGMTELTKVREFERWSISMPHLFLDANALQPPNLDHSEAIGHLLRWYDEEAIILTTPKGVILELRDPRTPEEVRRVGRDIYTVDVELNPDELRRRDSIAQAMHGNALSPKHEADADHLFEAAKYCAHIFVTHDQRILNREDTIQKCLESRLLVRELADAKALVELWLKNSQEHE